jgi:Homeodomain-like domain
VLPLAGDVGARFEAGADRPAGGGWAQHPVDRQEVGVQPRIVSLWRHRYADLGLEGLQDKPRPGKQPIYTKTTDKRILKLLDKPPPHGFARWTGPLLDDVDVQYVWRAQPQD